MTEQEKKEIESTYKNVSFRGRLWLVSPEDYNSLVAAPEKARRGLMKRIAGRCPAEMVIHLSI